MRIETNFVQHPAEESLYDNHVLLKIFLTIRAGCVLLGLESNFVQSAVAVALLTSDRAAYPSSILPALHPHVVCRCLADGQYLSIE